MELQLRPLQMDIMDLLRQAFREGHRNIMLYGPTGFGKTELAIALMDATAKNGKRAAMILDRIALCNQTSERLQKYQIEHGVLQSGHWRYRPSERIQVCSAQTLEKRGSFPGLDLLIVDEAHCKRAETTEFIVSNPGVRTIGLSATPFTEGLGNIYSTVISSTTTKQLVDEGWLCGLRVFVAKGIDMTGAKRIAGEWSQKDATERGIKVTGDIVSEWVKKTYEIFGRPRKTIVFCAGVAHGEDLSRQFAEAGYNFVSISYRDDDEFKLQAIQDFSRADTQIDGLIATDILTKGFDCADVMIGVSARPFSKSFSSHVQQMGRVMRPYPEKEFAVWLDHSGNYLRFRDKWDELFHSGVSDLHNADDKPQKEPTDKEKEASKCPRCGAIWPPASDICGHCGHVRQRKNDVIEAPGEMFEVSQSDKKEKYDPATKQRWYSELLGYAKWKAYKDGWAYHAYKDKFGVYPANTMRRESASTGPDVFNWITHRAIKQRKARR